MKKICFLIGSLNNSGGTERATTLIANELCKQGFNISILNLVYSSNSFFKLDDGIEVHSLYGKKVSFKKNLLGTICKIRQFVKKHEVNTLIVVDSISCVFTVPALSRLEVNHICWEHFNFNNNNGTKLRDIGRKLASRYCNYIVTLTNSDKELWIKGLNVIRSEILPIANPTSYEDIENTPSLYYKNVLSIGRLTHVKGFDLLIEAWSGVCESNKDWTLQIVGDGEEEVNLKQQAKTLSIEDRIEFIPANQDIDKYYKTSSFYCLSSRFEGLPMVLLEAQAFGLPIIAFNCDTGPSDVIEDKKNGWLVENGNVDKLAKNIEMAMGVYQNEYADLSRSAKQSSLRFSINTISKEWLKIL